MSIDKAPKIPRLVAPTEGATIDRSDIMGTMTLTTWREHLAMAMKENGDFGPVVAYAPDAAAFDVEFDDGYGSSQGPHVLAWTNTHVYFPVTYDGMENMDSAPRDPVTLGQRHVGGE